MMPDRTSDALAAAGDGDAAAIECSHVIHLSVSPAECRFISRERISSSVRMNEVIYNYPSKEEA